VRAFAREEDEGSHFARCVDKVGLCRFESIEKRAEIA
jgi:hypothetical protein